MRFWKGGGDECVDGEGRGDKCVDGDGDGDCVGYWVGGGRAR